MIGAKGFLGRAFLRFYQEHHEEVLGTHRAAEPELLTFDLSKANFLENLRSVKGFSYAVIAGGISQPRQCEKDPKQSYEINVEQTFTLCSYLIEQKITPIILSSGYVFDGQKGEYVEEDPTSPINTYGDQKCRLEDKLLHAFKEECIILRIAKVYGIHFGDGTLIDEMVASFIAGRRVLAATDQILSPILVDDVFKAMYELQKKGCRGLYHIGGVEALSRYELACQVAKSLQVETALVEPILLEQLSSRFKRPKRSDLLPHKILQETALSFTSLEEGMSRLLQSISLHRR
ncbi:MAG: dTDP-4-dehydrorhamnose reductase [Chlamydiales bacterium]|nr:dTDP-4-dehydrorhamnose reductase [Chlamydiales bacterium]MCH9619499.1 dTDP-4-dehydrorhamnose reductase [Chlamydiales bacterium]MCH9622303.1 dTDP-4-dehydrorhamnose reductase [Chlamydiales bacterium]